MNATMPTTHLVPVYVAYIDRPGQATEELLVADPEVFAAEAALLVGASISVRGFLVDPGWSEAVVADRLDTDLDARHFDDSADRLIPSSGAGSAGFSLRLGVDASIASVQAVNSAFDGLLLTERGWEDSTVAMNDEPNDGRTYCGTAQLRAAGIATVTLQRTIRRLYREGALVQRGDGAIAACSGFSAPGLERVVSRVFYSCDNCLDVFEDLSCPNDRSSCSDCCGESH